MLLKNSGRILLPQNVESKNVCFNLRVLVVSFMEKDGKKKTEPWLKTSGKQQTFNAFNNIKTKAYSHNYTLTGKHNPLSFIALENLKFSYQGPKC